MLETIESTTCGLTYNGLIECWGMNQEGRIIDIVYSEEPYVSIGCWSSSFVVFFESGQINCWGGHWMSREYENPPNDYKFKEVVSGSDESCGITIDDTVKCWGLNT
eukprot:UN13415